MYQDEDAMENDIWDTKLFKTKVITKTIMIHLKTFFHSKVSKIGKEMEDSFIYQYKR